MGTWQRHHNGLRHRSMRHGNGSSVDRALRTEVYYHHGRRSTIIMDGGSLDIEWRECDNHIYMTGPATIAFEGDIELHK